MKRKTGKQIREETAESIITTTFMIFIFIGLMFIGFRAVVSHPTIYYEDVCRLEFGDNWTYEYSQTFGATCVELDFISLEVSDRKLMNMTNKEIQKIYCQAPDFWDLSKWSSSCEGLK